MAVTRADVARAAGVSGTTVSFVMTGVWQKYGISKATYEKVKKVAAELGYIPNPAAKELRGGVTGRIGLMLWYVNRPFYATLTEAFYREATRYDKSLTLFIRKLDQEIIPFLKSCLAKSDGLVVMDEALPLLDYSSVPTPRKPLIFINPWLLPNVPMILNDMAGRIYLATRHLLARGYRHLYFNSVNPLRTRGFKAALEAAGIPFREEMLVGPGAYDYRHGEELADLIEITPDRKTGIIAANDYVAIACMHVLEKKYGKIAGHDYGIVGVDNIPAAKYTSVPLTSVYRSYEELAKATFTLWERLRNGEQIPEPVRIPNQIAIRESTAPQEGAGEIIIPEHYEPDLTPPSEEERKLLAEGC
ncbi:MAG: LacI family transcriptional regulator [Lentisphaerae bacterium]|nr:MAG: LacI family transcriptional regulator [Lentisphaerota bacterium]